MPVYRKALFWVSAAWLCAALVSPAYSGDTLNTAEPGAAMAASKKAMQAEEYIKAANILEQAVLASPQEPALHRQLGIAYHKTGRNRQAIARLEKTVELSPNDVEAHYALGVVHLARASELSLMKVRGALKRSINYLQATIELDRQHTAAHYYLIQVLINAPAIVGGDLDKARSLSAHLAELSPMHYQVVRSALAAREGRHDEAEELLLESYADYEQTPLLNFSLLAHYHARDQHSDAIEYGERYLRLPKSWDDTDIASAHYLLAQSYRALGQQQKSLQHYGLTLASTENKKLQKKVREEIGELQPEPADS
ncbi:tetratricopeptide repeat protein [Gilvimarinus sp. F26214L]|uniref:tetratricopeptide repeat protein n=1 Tax=Gilvimarinus sp. DZF01 TaxID=3461371 RepID=UPI004045AB68